MCGGIEQVRRWKKTKYEEPAVSHRDGMEGNSSYRDAVNPFFFHFMYILQKFPLLHTAFYYFIAFFALLLRLFCSFLEQKLCTVSLYLPFNILMIKKKHARRKNISYICPPGF